MRIKLSAVALLCITLSIVSSAYGEGSKDQVQVNKQYQIVFSTFDKSTAGDYAYLRDGVQSMLASRLSARERVNVLEKTFSPEELATLKKQEAKPSLTISGEKADYLVMGSLFSLTSGLEIQVDLYPLQPEEKILHFSVLSKTPNTLIADVEQLSGEIAQMAFGERMPVTGGTIKNGEVDGNKGFVTAHPEAAYKRNLYSGAVIGVAGSGVLTKGRGAKMTATLPVEMRAMAVGDVNGDGDKEILVLAGQKLQLFSTKKNTITQIADAELPFTIVAHAINLADLDGDGKEEIYISGTDGLYVSSMIMQYAASGEFQIVSSNIPWYLRPLNVPGKGWQLAGQKRGVAKLNLVSPGVFLVTLGAGNKIVQGERLALPASVNLFDFSYADIDGDGFYEIVAVDQKEKLRVYNPGNELVWVSKENFGSSKIYLGPSRGGATSEKDRRNFTVNEDAERELIFVPGRILVTDINKDGKQEILISEGEKIGFSLFNRLRFYDSGSVVSMAWNGSTLVESWRTGNLKGYLAGYGFSLLGEPKGLKTDENDSANIDIGRLFVGHLPKSGSLSDLLPGGAETELIVYDLEFSYKK